MVFWGVEVKSGKPYTHSPDHLRGRLRITQAVLGSGTATKKSLLQCLVGDKSPIHLCSLIPDKVESCGLDLEFEEDADVVFSVIGPRSIYLSGYYPGCGNVGRSGYDDDTDSSYGEDIADTETDDSGSYDSEDDEYEDDFIDDGDIEMFDSPMPNSGVVIEEIVDDKQLENGSDHNRSDDRQMVAKRRSLVLESEDEDGFPISSLQHKKGTDSNGAVNGVMRENSAEEKIDADNNFVSNSTSVLDQQTEEKDQNLPDKLKGDKRKKKEKLKKKKKDIIKDGESALLVESTLKDVSKVDNGTTSNLDDNVAASKLENNLDKKKKKKKRNKAEMCCESEHIAVENMGSNLVNVDNSVSKKKKKLKGVAATSLDSKCTQSEPVKQDASSTVLTEKANVEPLQTRTFPNGLIVEELHMGKPDGKKASSGKKVAVNYIGKLKNGKIFDSNIGQRPFSFRLGVGEVIKGWDVGVSGMRIGDKRRLTIPPSMGYGSKGVGQIPPNSWLIFDVELADAK